MKSIRTASHAARLVGLLALRWAYLAYGDLRWLLHIHFVHTMVTRTPLDFDYHRYLALSIANVAAALIAAFVLIAFPSSLLRTLSPATRRKRLLSDGWIATGVGIGLAVLLAALFQILATALWTVYQSARDSGWQIDLLTYGLVAVAGVIICRLVLARRGEG